MLGHSQRGLKRKMEENEDDEESLYELHRESVFNISMCKLNGYRQIPDPSLRRSVLICNTLRHIESEMEREGIQCSTIPASVGFLPAIQTDNMTLDPLPPQVHSIQCYPSLPATAEHPPQVVPVIGQPEKDEPLDYEKSLANLDTSGRATPFPSLQPDPCRTTDSGALWSVSEDRLSSINWSTVLNFSSQSEVDFTNNSSNSHCTFIGGSNLSPSASSNSSLSSSSSGNNEIFGDIDLSLYDFDLLPLSPPNMRLTPLSAEELLRSFPGNESLGAHPGNGCFKNEFLSEELDHIMHILVGM